MRRPHCPLTAPTLLEQLFCLPKGARLLLSVPPAGECLVFCAQRGGNEVLRAMNYQLPTCFCCALKQPCCFRMWECDEEICNGFRIVPFQRCEQETPSHEQGRVTCCTWVCLFVQISLLGLVPFEDAKTNDEVLAEAWVDSLRREFLTASRSTLGSSSRGVH